MFKRIYVPVDNSDLCQQVLDEGIKLCEAFNAELRVVHVLNFSHVIYGIEIVGFNEIKEALVNIAVKFKNHILKKLSTTNVKFNVEILETYDVNIAEMIIEDSKEWQADLLILGSHKLGSIIHLIKGGVVEEVSLHYHIPILLINKSVN